MKNVLKNRIIMKRLAVLAAVRTVDAGAIAGACADKAKIPGMIHAARVAAVKRLLDKTRDDQHEN